jgi:WXXGXW repeat (2 copies)
MHTPSTHIIRWSLYGIIGLLVSACNTPSSSSTPTTPSAVLLEAPAWSTPSDASHLIAKDGQPAPPVLKLEHPGKPPGNGYVWIAGHWNWSNGNYQWQTGRWLPVRRGHVWHPNTWRWQDERWVLEEGRWEREHHEGSAGAAASAVPYRR